MKDLAPLYPGEKPDYCRADNEKEGDSVTDSNNYDEPDTRTLSEAEMWKACFKRKCHELKKVRTNLNSANYRGKLLHIKLKELRNGKLTARDQEVLAHLKKLEKE